MRRPAPNRSGGCHALWSSALAVTLLLAIPGIFYLRLEMLLGTGTLEGVDFGELHIRRIRFAKDALLGFRHTLPAWYPHEALGSPFAANLQSFPWIPTRLLLLLLDPSITYGPAIAIAAALSALFTWLYCRRAGLTRIGALAAGGTFACAGYFASRVMAGHLPLLEAYPALPLLLWLVDRALAPERAHRHRFDLGVLAVCSACVVAAGHPQLPAYSVAAALLYAGWKKSGAGWKKNGRVAGAITLGSGLSLAVWWPMLLLIGRSTRLLRLAAADNDLAMPYSRLLALVMPGIHGWADPVELADRNPFNGFPNDAWFWDTANYVGILPLLAIAALLVGCVVQKRMPVGRWLFLSALGIGAFLCSLPFASPLLHLLPGTLLRSPARVLYVSTFCAAIALGKAVDAALSGGLDKVRVGRSTVLRNGLVLAALFLHFIDLWGFDHLFIHVTPRGTEKPPEFQAILASELGDGRIAQEPDYRISSNTDRYDDAGGFDSIFLARFYRGIHTLAGDPPELNQQRLDASILPVKALEAAGVRFVITTHTRADLERVASEGDENLYRVPNPAPRVDFFTRGQTEYATDRQIPELFAANPRNRLLLPTEAESRAQDGSPPPISNTLPAASRYSRPSSDEIVVRTASGQSGFAYVLEAFDPGWKATVDNARTAVVPANGFAIAVPVPAGSHTIRLRYETPGRTMGACLSLLSLGLLVALIVFAPSGPQPSVTIPLHTV